MERFDRPVSAAVSADPEYAVLGQTRYDQNWIDSNTEAGVAACGWQRPKARPQGLSKATGGKQLAPAKKNQPGLIGRITRAVAPSASAQTSAPAARSMPELPSVPAAPAKPRDPVDELLEPSDAPPELTSISGKKSWAKVRIGDHRPDHRHDRRWDRDDHHRYVGGRSIKKVARIFARRS